MKLLAIVFVSMCILASCASLPKQPAWPNDIPPHSFYVSEYEHDLENQRQQNLDSYLKWVISFYHGSELYSNGWRQMTNDALESIEGPDERALVQNKLHWIGEKVSAEWAKSNSLRLINTRHVSIWSISLDESITQRKPLWYINKVVRDVNAILAGLIEPDSITDYRYFPESEDFFF
ncbi:MAG: hypothetical protein JKY25_05970 [Robiginitomaculum sp.]|nr:hypothetical protein [Robiginitomaculum sp.]